LEFWPFPFSVVLAKDEKSRYEVKILSLSKDAVSLIRVRDDK
jgi:hypothetical protein